MSYIIEENGVKVEFPDNNYFQFDTCPAYISIKSQGVKETDVCWFDLSNNTLWFVELKAFDNPLNFKYKKQDLSISDTIEHWLNELKDKSIHAVSMVLTNRSGTQSCVPIQLQANTAIKIMHLVKVMHGQDSYLDPMQNKLRVSLKPYQAIFKIDNISIVSYDFAVANSLLSWIV